MIDYSAICPTCGQPTKASAITVRQQEVLDLLVTGMRPRAIAGRLGISTEGVEAHLSNIKQRLRLGGNMNLVAYEVNRRALLRGADPVADHIAAMKETLKRLEGSDGLGT